MTDPRVQLGSKYSLQNRYANFGGSLKSVHIKGFRGIEDLRIEFTSPVMVVTGMNGAGKSTVGQLCLGAYKKPTTVTNIKRFYIRDFFPASVVDPSPFSQGSSVVFEYNTTDIATPQTLTVVRTETEWSGYKRQPERSCYYIGFTIYIPKVEQRDLSIYRSAHLALGAQRPIPPDVRERVGRILGQQYDAMHFQAVTHAGRNNELGIATRFGSQYSENNMGFGEGRTLYLVDLLENSPEQSLFVIEEPETSLHENAQFELGRYFLDVCNRRHHQIILTTHSSTLVSAFAPESRLMLLRDGTGVAGFPNMSAGRVRSMLSAGRQRELAVLVEDEFAKLLLTEMVRRIEPAFLRCMVIYDVGDTKAVRSGALLMRKLGRTYAAVRDADTGPDVQNGIYSFPGALPPEKEVFHHVDVVAGLRQRFDIEVTHVLVQNEVSDHHKYAEVLAREASTTEDHLSITAIHFYLDSLGQAAYQGLVDALRARLP